MTLAGLVKIWDVPMCPVESKFRQKRLYIDREEKYDVILSNRSSRMKKPETKEKWGPVVLEQPHPLYYAYHLTYTT